MADDFVWELMVADLGLVRFVGELPGGYPTEMWLDGEIVERDMGGSFAWSTDGETPVPTPVHEINQTVENHQGNREMLCAHLHDLIAKWNKLADDQTNSQASRIRFAVYTQYATAVYSVEGCGG